jgi:hypothetical protein
MPGFRILDVNAEDVPDEAQGSSRWRLSRSRAQL